jgi:hypothetical protein
MGFIGQILKKKKKKKNEGLIAKKIIFLSQKLV